MIPVIFGFESYELNEDEINLFKNYKPYGYVIFTRNCKSIEQIKILTNHLREISKPYDPVIFIDQEGGRVQRIRPPISSKKYPDSFSFFKLGQKNSFEEAYDSAKENYEALAQELYNFGICGNFLPCVDILYDFTNDIIGDRSFGYDTSKIIDFAKIVKKSHDKFSVKTVMKHIPGHGRSVSDSHLELPVVIEELEVLEGTDFLVFKNLANEFEYAMTAHIIYECLDSNNPVTTSKEALNYIRNKIKFQGKIITDCITMEALKGNMGSRARKSLDAGCDIVLHCSGNIDDMKDIIMSIK